MPVKHILVDARFPYLSSGYLEQKQVKEAKACGTKPERFS
jgi:hypothetical protein